MYSVKSVPIANVFDVCFDRYCKVPVQKALLSDLLPGAVTLVFERSEKLNADLNPFTSVSFFFFHIKKSEITLKIILSWRAISVFSTKVFSLCVIPLYYKTDEVFMCPPARGRPYPWSFLHETPLSDVRRTTCTHQCQHQLSDQHCGCACKWEWRERGRDAHTDFISSSNVSVQMERHFVSLKINDSK